MKVLAWILLALCTCYIGALEQGPHCPIRRNAFEVILLPDDTDCGNYYLCLDGYAIRNQCPDGQHWSVERNNCQPIEDANCQIKTMRSGIEDGALHAGCPMDEDPNKPTQFQNPENCGQFFKCSYGRAYLINCPLGLHWDTSGNRCESPFVAKCRTGVTTVSTTQPTPTSSTTFTTIKSSSTSTSSSTTQVPLMPESVPECSDPSSTRRFGIPGECKLFLQCHLGKAYRIPCRKDREWSTTANDCIDAALAGCSTTLTSTSILISTTKSIITPTTPPPAATNQPATCSTGIEYISHPTECNMFIQCDNGKAIEKYCPAGLFWSKTSMNCQWTSSDCR